jgi:hypothetical protein
VPLGIEVAEGQGSATLRSPSGVIKQRRQLIYEGMKRILTVILMATVFSLSQGLVFGQKGNSNRPPKEPEKIKEQPKPPPGNNNSGGNSNRRKP